VNGVLPDFVTAIVIVLLPALRAIDPEDEPLATVVPFTFIVEPKSVCVGVTVIELVELLSITV